MESHRALYWAHTSLIYINDLIDQCETHENLFVYADDAKIYKHITSPVDIQDLQHSINNIKKWCDEWLLQLNADKCKVISYGRSNSIKHNYSIENNNTSYFLQSADNIKDLGVIFDCKLKFDDHIHEKVNKAYSIIGILKRNFINLSQESFILLYKSLVRPHLEYAQSVWSPFYKGLIEELEKVQMRATKLVKGLKELDYKHRLKLLKLPTLKYR